MPDYLALIQSQPQDKTALFVDGTAYTYGDLVQKAKTLQEALPRTTKRAIYVIQKDNILDQLLMFFACQSTLHIPLLIPADYNNATDLETVAIPANAVMAVMTSGTTGTPKILFRTYESWAGFFDTQNAVFSIDSDTRLFAQGSLAFTGNLNLYLGVFAVGATVIAENNFNPKHWIEVMKSHNANAVYLIPSKLLLLPRICQQTLPDIRMIVSGSQSLGKQDAEQLKRIFPNTRIVLYYGSSELNYITYVTDEEMGDARNLIGKPFPAVSVTLINGELFVQTPYHVEGISLPCSIHDTGEQDASGNFYFTGRNDEMLQLRGRKLSAIKIENAIGQLDGVLENAVVVKPHKNDMVLAAYVVTRQTPAPSAAQLMEQLRAYLESYEVPKQWNFVTALPKNESGKIDKNRLS